jgi:hypothetical protein
MWERPITNDARCRREIKFRISMARTVFNKKETVFSRKLDLNLREKLAKCYIWSITCVVLKFGHFGKIDQLYVS